MPPPIMGGHDVEPYAGGGPSDDTRVARVGGVVHSSMKHLGQVLPKGYPLRCRTEPQSRNR